MILQIGVNNKNPRDDHYQTLSGIETSELGRVDPQAQAMITTKPFQGLKLLYLPELPAKAVKDAMITTKPFQGLKQRLARVNRSVVTGDDHYQTLSGIETFTSEPKPIPVMPAMITTKPFQGLKPWCFLIQ